METRVLLQFFFETGDASCRFYEVRVIVLLTDGVCSMATELVRTNLEETANRKLIEDIEYEVLVEETMAATGLSWEFAPFPIGCINNIIPFFA